MFTFLSVIIGVVRSNKNQICQSIFRTKCLYNQIVSATFAGIRNFLKIYLLEICFCIQMTRHERASIGILRLIFFVIHFFKCPCFDSTPTRVSAPLSLNPFYIFPSLGLTLFLVWYLLVVLFK